MMWRISALADTALLAPVSALLLLYLLLRGGARTALALGLALGLGLGATLLAKLLFHACGAAITDLDVTSPSGHASFATIFYGALAAMVADERPRAVRIAIWSAAAAVLIAVGISRVGTGSHSAPEVALGALIGVLALLLFLTLKGPERSPPLWPLIAAGGVAAAIVVLGGYHLTFEHSIERVAHAANLSLDICVSTARADSLDIPLRR